MTESERELLAYWVSPYETMVSILAPLLIGLTPILVGFAIGVGLKDTAAILIATGVLVGFILIIVYNVNSHQKPIKQDLSNGNKVVYIGKIENKREVSTDYSSYYYFAVIEQEFKIEFSYWEKMYIGQPIRFEFALHCRHIFLLILSEEK